MQKILDFFQKNRCFFQIWKNFRQFSRIRLLFIIYYSIIFKMSYLTIKSIKETLRYYRFSLSTKMENSENSKPLLHPVEMFWPQVLYIFGILTQRSIDIWNKSGVWKIDLTIIYKKNRNRVMKSLLREELTVTIPGFKLSNYSRFQIVIKT